MATKKICDRCGCEIPLGWHGVRVGKRVIELCIKCYGSFVRWENKYKCSHKTSNKSGEKNG